MSSTNKPPDQLGKPKLNSSNLSTWLPSFLDGVILFGAPTLAIRRYEHYNLTSPCITDCLKDSATGLPTTERIYDITEAGSLASDSRKALRDDIREYERKLSKLREQEAGLLTYLLDNISIASRIILATYGERYSTALSHNDVYIIWVIIIESHSKGSGRTT